MQIVMKMYPLLLMILSRNKTLALIKGHNCVMNFPKFVRNNPKLDLVNINVNGKFSPNPFIHSQNIKRNKILTSIKGHNSVMN